MNELLQSVDPKLRTAIYGAIVMFVVDFLTYRKSVRRAQAASEAEPEWAWELTLLKCIAGFTGGFGLGGAAEVVTPPETPPVVFNAIRALLA